MGKQSDISKNWPKELSDIIKECINRRPSMLQISNSLYSITNLADMQISDTVELLVNSYATDMINDMLIIMARANNLLAKQILCMVECENKNDESARRWVRDVIRQEYKSLFEVARINKFEKVISLLCEKGMKLGSLQDYYYILRKNLNLASIDLSESGISDEGAKAIAEALKINNTLTNIDWR